MRCGFCFATFQDIQPDILPEGHLGREGCLSVVESLARAGFRKINFAGGEPTLCRWLPELINRARELGLTTSVVTNGSRLTREWLESIQGSLDWATLSIDSMDPDTMLRMGRTTRSGPMSEQDYINVIDDLKEFGIRLKINTVLTRYNINESLAGFITKTNPERWKLLQVLPVKGQNDYSINQYLVSDDEFDRYVQVNRVVESYGTRVVPENNNLMTGSYVMVDPAGRFFDNVAGSHTYSKPILEVGVETALREVTIDPEKFLSRDGLYDW